MKRTPQQVGEALQRTIMKALPKGMNFALVLGDTETAMALFSNLEAPELAPFLFKSTTIAEMVRLKGDEARKATMT